MYLAQLRSRIFFLTFLLFSTCIMLFPNRAHSAVSVRFGIVSPVPQPRETILVPPGYVKCRIVGGGWSYNGWVPQHRVCYYAKYPRRTWVQGHWVCTHYSKSTGQCRYWIWQSSRWYDRVIYY